MIIPDNIKDNPEALDLYLKVMEQVFDSEYEVLHQNVANVIINFFASK